MNRYVLFLLCICVIGAALYYGSPKSVRAEYFNDSLISRKAEKYFEGELYEFTPDEELIEMKRESLASDQDVGPVTVGLRPPEEFPKPQTVESDSIQIKKLRVKRTREVPGIRRERMEYIPLDQYKAFSLQDTREKLWRKNDTRMKSWEDREDTGESDVGFSLPMGSRFESFMGGKTRLDINGSQKITFSGRSEWTEGQIESATSKNSSFPSLTMKQEPRFSIKGSVGERIYVDIDQDARSGSFSNLEENIKITYQGEKNEIIQFIEAGSTSLNLEGATFAGYRGSHKGLFGVRGEGRLGPLKFTAIASQEKSEANTQSFRGSAEEKTTEIRDYLYKTNTYFFVDNVFKRQYEEDRTSFDLIQFDPNNSLKVLEVYVDDGINTNNLKDNTFALRGVAKPMIYDEVADTVFDDVGIDGYYHRLDPQQDYYVDRDLGFIVFSSRVADNWSVGVYIETEDGRTFGDLTYDTQDENSQITLKLVKAKNQRASNQDTWDLEWKNVYDLGQRNIDPEGLQIRIKREATEGVDKDNQNGTPYIHILGLDLQDEFGNDTPDNKIDINRGFVNLGRGELIFPLLRPFDSDSTPEGVNTELGEKVPEIYDTQNQQEKEEASKYYIEIQTANQQATMKLPVGMGGILEGTEQVTADGKVLTKGTDYRINYMTGEVTLLSEAALNPSAQININYEEANAFQQMQKTLFGMRGEYDLWGESRLGATFLFNNESTRDKRVRLGQEPSRMALFDTDMELNFQPEILTTAVDKLPLVVANQASRVRLEGEFAKSMPTMNTRGAVYIDDFEGSRNTPLNIVRTGWTPASKPDENSLGRAMTRGNLLWYNPWDRIDSRSIWPNKETSVKEGNTVHVLNLAYGKPKDVLPDEGYGGIQTAFYGAGEDLSRARFIEIWARGNKGDLKIDIGSITEDFYPYADANGVLDTEDIPVPGQGQGDGVLTKEEDTGLDGVFDSQEPGYSGSNPDPSGDNWRYKDKNDYSMINGLEGNAADSDRAGLPDTEDINRNGILDVRNSYYEYTISFDDPFDEYLVPDSVPEGNPAGWRLFRIPLWNNPAALVGGDTPPDSTLVEFARMWVTGVDTTLIQIASIEVVENNWLEEGIYMRGEDGGEQDVTDEVTDVIRVSRTNTDENLEYTPPPGVKVEIDPDTKVRRMEQSLTLIYENLDNGNTAYAYRQFEKMDFTDYTSMRMYVHGSDDLPLPAEGGRDVELVFRYGGDKDNYYEIRTPVYRGWAKESYVDADFATATNVKLARDLAFDEKNREKNQLAEEVQALVDSGGSQEDIDALNARITLLDADLDDIDSPGVFADTIGTQVYSLSGSPSLQNIKVITVGVRNNKQVERITGEVWINELRMDEVRDMGGTAARAKITTDLAGFINLEGGATTKTADFHDMNSKKGSGSDALDWNASVKMNVDRFTPAKWNLSIPVSASTTESSDLPRLKSGSDIILNDQQKEDEKAESFDRKYSISYRKGRDQTLQGVKKHLVGWTMEKVDAAYHWGERTSHNPMSGDDTQVTQQLKVGYDVNPQEKSLHPLKWLDGLPAVGEKLGEYEFTYTPKELNYNYTMDESERNKLNIDNVADTTHTKTGKHVYNFGYSPIKSLSYTYILNKEDDLIISKETGYKETNNVTYKGPDLFKFVTHNYTYRTVYDEDDNPRYSLSGSLGSKSINHSEDFSANASVAWDDMFEKLKTVPKQPEKKESNGKDKEKKADDGDAEDDAAESDENKEERKPPGEPIRNKVVMALAETFNPITLEYKKRDNLKYGGIADRPGFMTRFGSGTIQEADSASVVTRQNMSSLTKSYVARTDFELPLDMGVQTRFSIDEEEKNSSSAFTRDKRTSYPDMTFRWRRVEKVLPVVSKYLTNLQIESGYSIDNTKSWRDESVEPLTDKTKKQFKPLINVSTQIKSKFSTSFSLSQSSEDSYDISGTTRSYSLTEQNDMRMQVRYRLTSSKGFFGMKLRSDVDLTLDFTTKGMERSKRIGDEDLTLIEKTDSWTISPNMEYKFSSKFRGGARMDFSNAKDLTNKVHKVREVSIWGQLEF